MITTEMYQIFDRSESNRRMHYGGLRNAELKMHVLLFSLSRAQGFDGFLDLGIRDRDGEYWIPLTRPGMPNSRTGLPRRDLDLVEYMTSWANGVRKQARDELREMDARYPELSKLAGSKLMQTHVQSDHARQLA